MMVSGGVSGGHLNPAITVAMASVGKFPWRKVRTICCILDVRMRMYSDRGHLKGKLFNMSSVASWKY